MAPGSLFDHFSGQAPIPPPGSLFGTVRHKPVGAKPDDSPLFTDAHARTYEKRHKLPAGSVAHAYRRTLSGCAVDVLTKLLETRPTVDDGGNIQWPKDWSAIPGYGRLSVPGRFPTPGSAAPSILRDAIEDDESMEDFAPNAISPIPISPTPNPFWADYRDAVLHGRRGTAFWENGDGVPADRLTRSRARKEHRSIASMLDKPGQRSGIRKYRSDGTDPQWLKDELRRRNAVRERHDVAGEFGTAGVSGVRRRNAVRENNSGAGAFGGSGAFGGPGTFGTAGTSGAPGAFANAGTTGLSGNAGISTNAGTFGTYGALGVAGTFGLTAPSGTAGTFATAGSTGIAGPSGTSDTFGNPNTSGLHRSNAVRERHDVAGMLGTAGRSGLRRSNAVRRRNNTPGTFTTPGAFTTPGTYTTPGPIGAGGSGLRRSGAIRRRTNPRRRSSSPPARRTRSQSRSRSQSRADSMSPRRKWT